MTNIPDILDKFDKIGGDFHFLRRNYTDPELWDAEASCGTEGFAATMETPEEALESVLTRVEERLNKLRAE